jgi:hypothetical protein
MCPRNEPADNTASPQLTKDQTSNQQPANTLQPSAPAEVGGREGLEPTRYGDWEKGGRCIDF